MPVFEGFRPENLDWGPARVVVGNVCTREHVEVRAAEPDAGPYLPPDAGPPDNSGGCGCRATDRRDLGTDGLLLLAPLLVLGRRRIRR